jgi:intein/homing endonuclease
MSIEKVRLGDRVLSQNQDTGELTYKLVIDTTIRPSSPTSRIGLDGQEIAATLGHPIWVVGKEWRMAKEIEAGDYLHGLRGGVPVRYIEKGPDS